MKLLQKWPKWLKIALGVIAGVGLIVGGFYLGIYVFATFIRAFLESLI